MLKRQLISIVSAVLLAAHVSAGCCAHHQHAFDGSATISLVTAHDHEREHAADGDCHGSVPQHEHQPGDHHCGEGHCVFLKASRTSLPELTATAAIAPTSAAALLAHLDLLATTQNAPPVSTAFAPVRTHLAKQVHLI